MIQPVTNGPVVPLTMSAPRKHVPGPLVIVAASHHELRRLRHG